MGNRIASRRSKISRSQNRNITFDSAIESLQRAIQEERLVPVIGDSIRLDHIFDVKTKEDLGATGTDAGVDTELPNEFSVSEQLADLWAEEIEYPLSDSHHMARVAQFQVVERDNAIVAKEDYLAFLKRVLLDIAADVADLEHDTEFGTLVEALRGERTLSFADIVSELDFPRFEEGKEDPLDVLARLPVKIYLTTSHYDFIERALTKRGKQPQTRFCFWSMKPENAAMEYRYDPSYEPAVNTPVVYHLFGIEKYPESMVISEDDHLRFLWRLANGGRSDSGERIIPPYLQAELNASSLLLLGYRLEDWDLRVLFHGLLNADREAAAQRRPSVAIQIDPKEQPLVDSDKVSQAQKYLNDYFRKAEFQLKCMDTDTFIGELWDAWQRWNQGAPS